MSKPECFSTNKVEIREGKINADCLMCSLSDECDNQHRLREELKATEGKPEPQFGERHNPLTQWRHQPRF